MVRRELRPVSKRGVYKERVVIGGVTSALLSIDVCRSRRV